jgi:riboflavin synthase
MGRLEKIERRGTSGMIVVAADFPEESVRLGDSIAVNGVCLTVTEMRSGRFSFDVSPETLDRTSFRAATTGAPVNLERALRLSDRLGGHLVSGHVDCVSRLVERNELSGNIVFSFELPTAFARYMVEKGSVAVDGISLTVNSVTETGFSVNVIPHTATKTTLAGRRPGEFVNIETDILGKYLERLMGGVQKSRDDGGLSLELLAKSGFL